MNKQQDLWYKDAIIYQLHVKTFSDSNNDGIGDFKGLTSKLDYLSELGINTIWLLPFYPSPLRDDGYDIADYYNINPSYGNLKDFKNFLKEAHARDLKVITELVVNHTSDQHPWFQKARTAKKGSIARDFYMWNETPEKFPEARIIFKDFETSNWAWDNVAKAYYWHRFYSHQPDLNYDSEHVHKAIFKITDYWFNMGVDGVRLDAIPYLYAREGTNCENLPETHAFLKKLRKYVDDNHPGKMLLAEANQWPEDSVAYFGEGNECNMSFHFPLMPRMYMAVQMEDRFPVIDILEQTPSIPDNCQWALFLRNHDELTLEMVTDEERDYMYRVYAKDQKARINLGIRRRLAPLLKNNRRKIELMNLLLFSLPGSPIIYYGDEIGMGDNYYLGDRNGVRTPMQWSSDKNAGFSKASPQELYLPIIIEPEYHYEAINVENQENNSSSLLHWTKKLISARKKYQAFSRGTIEFINSNNHKILSFIRKYNDELILVVVNLSGYAQSVFLNLNEFIDYIPRDIFSKNKFPKITENYFLTLGSYDCYWFILEKTKTSSEIINNVIFELETKLEWEKIPFSLKEEYLEEEIIPNYLKKTEWFDKEIIESIKIVDCIYLDDYQPYTEIFIFEISSSYGNTDTYLLPVSLGKTSDEINSEAILVRVNSKLKTEIIYDSFYNKDIRLNLLKNIMSKNIFKGKNGELGFTYDSKTKHELGFPNKYFNSTIIKSSHNNTLVNFDNTLFLKVYRKLENNINQDIELIDFLSKNNFSNVSPIVGTMTYKGKSGNFNLCIVQKYIQNEGEAWKYTIDSVARYLDRLISENTECPPIKTNSIFIDNDSVDIKMQNMIGIFYLEMIQKLGKITGEMHEKLCSNKTGTFSPEGFTVMHQRSIYQAARINLKKAILSLQQNKDKLDKKYLELADNVIKCENTLLNLLKKVIDNKIPALKIRIHGNYTLEQFIYTGKDFSITDFSGDDSKALSERRLKKSPLRDISDILRSMFYAVYVTYEKHQPYKNEEQIKEYIDSWYKVTSSFFLNSYHKSISDSILKLDKEYEELLIKIFIIDKMFESLDLEINYNPKNAYIPLYAINYLLKCD